MTLSAIKALAPELHAIVDSPPALDALTLTDAGNARRLVRDHDGELLYVPGLGWHEWDGRRFAPDRTGAVMRRAKATARALYDEARADDDADTRKLIAKHAARSESEPRLRAMIALAESEPEFVVEAAQLDAQPDLLNLLNGTLDLATGRLGAHDPRDRLTRLAPVKYDAGAVDERLDRFLGELFRDRPAEAPELVAYLQRVVGYTLTGHTGEERLFFLHGGTATGKSTFLGAFGTTLGDYATTADFETFVRQHGDGGIRNDIARLAGARLVTSLEVDDGRRLAEGLVKQITGGDTIAARFLYRESFEFRPAFKLFLAANSRPRVNASDDAIWRRIDQIPFTATVPVEKRDPELKRHLTSSPEARSALLAWAVRGNAQWRRTGIATPASVRAYTDSYRAENDPLAEWIDARCELRPGLEATAAKLRASYEEFAGGSGEKPVGTRSFAAALTSRGCEQTRRKDARYWRGIDLQVTR
ncbi:MAG: DNA primase family protein [Solirubrobacteraceae bacterium]